MAARGVESSSPGPVADRWLAPATAVAGVGGDHEAVASVLGRVRAELLDLHAVVLGLQDTLSPVLLAAGADPDVSKGSQALDLVAQSLDGLSTFIGSLAAREPGLDRWDAAAAAKGIGLHGLAARLAGAMDDPRPRDDDPGALELL